MTSSIKENPRLRAAAEELRKAGIKVGDAVGEALKSMEESEIARAVRTFLFSVAPVLTGRARADLSRLCGRVVDD